MANGHGGYRKPTNPAPVSGPGAHSARTDGQPMMSGLGNGDYGSEQAMEQIQQGAPMAYQPDALGAAPGTSSSAPQGNPQAQAALAAISGLTPLDAPSERPGVPVTDGADSGPGNSSAALGIPQTMTDLRREDANYYRKYLPVFIKAANADDASPGFKQFVRNLIGYLS